MTANAMSLPRDLQSAAAAATGQKEGKKKNGKESRRMKCCGVRDGNTALREPGRITRDIC